MNDLKITLIAKEIEYGSQIDEAAFFYWIDKIEGILWKGVHDSIHIDIPSNQIEDGTLRELLALFYRYKIDSQQLTQFINDSNRSWVLNKHAYWYSGLMGL
ncbi:hypothetical protein QN372_04200 [Undibacterium sp. RTI2.1]|uniref:hypothetical protein n=1 Tax=unclassified Undibacterium TaxID=2630295 RepID=UPI002AB3A9EC|nr:MULTISPECIES: hypothetical protein [unclassified Undibacterium]MDY7540333.1 hypothetical protein [Undibacterium sp. 5I1]MEB0029941.1 hypothetical protein [Undibacterium sp. RTI2.1]MEB0117095.1 hypothetical protein [Undibacterium sp. RTI2.2]MEB0229965.1 hypothetical protein [Undibacterium sp. 10I3]MEB0259502.1 hypothetical protein [Undibacterium sp. 5I1]